MKPDDTLLAWIAEADPARRAGPSAPEKRELAERVRQRVLHTEPQPARRRSRPRIGSIVGVTGSVLVVVVVAVVGLILVGHHRALSSIGPRPAHRQTLIGTTGTFAVLARPRTNRDRIPAAFRGLFLHTPVKLELGRSALIISTSKQRVWLIPAGRELCFAQVDLRRSGRFGGGGTGCGATRYYELHGLQLGVSSTTFNVVLPEHASPVQVTFTDGSSIQLNANASGVITHNFIKPARLISYTGPTGLQINLKPCTPREQQPCLTNSSPPFG
jgi:hypothetical protein